MKHFYMAMFMCLCVSSVFMTGCFGTILSRSCDLDDAYFFGKPVYGAVGYLPNSAHVDDWCGTGRILMAPYVLVSIPMDFILDTAFLPVDLVAWGLGYEKDNNELRTRYWEESKRHKEESKRHRDEGEIRDRDFEIGF